MNVKSFGYCLSALALATAVPVSSIYADALANCTAELSASSCLASDATQLVAGVGNTNIKNISLGADIEIARLGINRDLELDLNGHALGASNSDYTILISNQSKVTIDDKTTSKNGKIWSGRAGSVVSVNQTSELTFNSGTIKSESTGSAYGVSLWRNSSFTMNGGTIDTSNGDAATVAGNGTEGQSYNIYLNGGHLKSKWQAIYMPNQIDLHIKGDTVIDGGVFIRMGQVEIGGNATINSILAANEAGTDSIQDYYSNASGYAWHPDALVVVGGNGAYKGTDGDNSLNLKISDNASINAVNSLGHAVAIYDVGNASQEMNIEISGGKFTAVNQDAIIVQNLEEILGSAYASRKTGFGEIDNAPSLAISGGTFSSKPSDKYLTSNHETYDFSTDEEKRFTVLGPVEVKKSENDDLKKTSDQATIKAFADNSIKELLKTDLKSLTVDEDGYYTSGGVRLKLEGLQQALIEGKTIATSYEQQNYTSTASAKESIEELNNDSPEAYVAIKSILGEQGKIAGGFIGNIHVGTIGEIYQLNEPISFAYELPEDTPSVAEGYTRTYYVVRVHFNYETGKFEVEKLETTLDGSTVKSESDKFSAFYIAYEDTAIEEATTNPKTLDKGGFIFATVAGASIPLILWGAYLATKRI